ncbi:MAG: ComEC/Rec2 family competence protein [Actinomycetota bacterium]
MKPRSERARGLTAAWYVFAVGLGISGLFAVVGRVLVATVLAVAMLAVSLRANRMLAVLAVGIMVGAALSGMRLSGLDQGLTAQLAQRAALVDLVGEVILPPQEREDETRLRFAVVQVSSDGTTYRTSERILVQVRGGYPAGLGSRLLLEGVVLRPAISDSSFGARRWQAIHRISARTMIGADQIRGLGGSRNPLRRLAAITRANASELAERLPTPAGGLLLGMTIGDTSLLPAGVQEDMRIAGLTHLVAVSGSNIALVLAALALILRGLRITGWPRYAVLLCAIAFMAVVTAFEPSVIRASIMAAFVIVGIMFGARTDAIHLLGVAICIALVADPFLALQLGFQLSVLATLGLLTVAKRLADRFEDRPILLAASAAIGAQTATTPLLALTMGEVSLVAIPANLLVGALVAPVTIIGFASIAVGVFTDAAIWIARVAVPAALVISHLARTLAAMPGAIVAVPDGVAGMILILASVATLLALGAGRARVSRATALALVLLIPAAGGVFAACSKPPPLVGLTVTMLDVGQGDAILVTLGQNAMLVDGGDDAKGLSRMLRRRGIDSLDYMVITHPHDDHISGLAEIIDRARVGRILDPGLDAPLPDYQRILKVRRQRGIPYEIARTGQRYPFGDATIEILWPSDPLLQGTDSDLNENSIVMRIDYGTDCVLLAGETQELSQRLLLQRFPDRLRCEVLKVSHHGSARMEPDFYRATQAQIAMIPVGRNGYGHPAGSTLVALEGMRVLRSDQHGVVEVALDGRDGISWRTER